MEGRNPFASRPCSRNLQLVSHTVARLPHGRVARGPLKMVLERRHRLHQYCCSPLEYRTVVESFKRVSGDQCLLAQSYFSDENPSFEAHPSYSGSMNRTLLARAVHRDMNLLCTRWHCHLRLSLHLVSDKMYARYLSNRLSLWICFLLQVTHVVSEASPIVIKVRHAIECPRRSHEN